MSVVVKRATSPVQCIEAGNDTDGWGGNLAVFRPTKGPRSGYPALELAAPGLVHLRTTDARLLAEALFDWADEADLA